MKDMHRSLVPFVGESAAPLGATVFDTGVNFSIYSRGSTLVELLLFDRVDDDEPARVIPIDPASQREYHYWHRFVPGLQAGQLYGYRASGPYEPARGYRFDRDKVLLDPYGRAVAVPPSFSRDPATKPGGNAATAMKSVVVDPADYDWQGDRPLNTSSSRTVVYELHVRGFTRHPSSGVMPEKRGTYAGLVEKIPYLQALGITAVELLPVFQFDRQAVRPGANRVNYWGYAPVSFFAPHQAYSSRQDMLGPINEFRDMVKALHRAGIEVILDVVFNHTAEDDETGPTYGFKGLDNRGYYILDRDGGYADYTGCGNTLNGNHPIVRRMIVDSLKYWVEYMHVDGFRFDLASVLTRDSSGHPMPNPPLIWDIESEPALACTKLIAEAWDAAGLYQVGTFIGDAWKEWNGRFRDDVRSFFRGENGMVGHLADRLLASHDVYGHKGRDAEASVNFITCHDGFSLNDLVSYDQKHNEVNGEQNRDGANDNRSWNCGVEGPTDEPAIEGLRNRQVKNFLAVTLLSLGVPMILMGDEMRRTQGGNNNAYCHDDESNWLDWGLLNKHADVHRFVRLLLKRRLFRDETAERERIPLAELIQRAKIVWHGVKLLAPDWSAHSHSLAMGAELGREHLGLHLILNAYWEPLEFELPATGGDEPWHVWIDTALEAPHDVVPWPSARPFPNVRYRAAARSVVVLWRGLEKLTQRLPSEA
jgi:glycogen operon protein